MAGPRRRAEEEGGSRLGRAVGGCRTGMVVVAEDTGVLAYGAGVTPSGWGSRTSLVEKEEVLATIMLGRWLEVGSQSSPSSDLVERWAYNKA